MLRLLLVFSISLAALSSAQAATLGTYRCEYLDELTREAMSINFDLDSNVIKTVSSRQNPNDLRNWKTIYSPGESIFCGYKPASTVGLICPFQTQVTAAGYISKDLLCEKQYASGSKRVVTQGNLYFWSTSKPAQGSIQCFVNGRRGFRANFTNCYKTPAFD